MRVSARPAIVNSHHAPAPAIASGAMTIVEHAAANLVSNSLSFIPVITVLPTQCYTRESAGRGRRSLQPSGTPGTGTTFTPHAQPLCKHFEIYKFRMYVQAVLLHKL